MLVESKVASLRRCVDRARDEVGAAGSAFRNDYTRQDAAILNVLRACELALDLANHLVRRYRLGLPGSARESFRMLRLARLVEPDLGERLEAMTAFRNIAVHRYGDVDLAIVELVVRDRLDDLLAFAALVLRLGDEATGPDDAPARQ